MYTKEVFNQKMNRWINIDAENEAELKNLYRDFGIDREFVDYSLDRNERAHMDYDKATDVLLLIFNTPNRRKIDNHYETVPVTFILVDRTLITVTTQQSKYLYFEIKNYLEKNPDCTLFELLFSSLFIVSDQYFPFVEGMDRERKRISNLLKEKTTKQNLLLLSDLETGIVYFVTASRQNVLLVQQVKSHGIYRRLSDQEKERLDDVLIEAQQLVEMTQLSSQILQQLSGTYNNILNNNLNDTMRVLTVLSVLLTVPTIVSGFFGMNMPLPLEHSAIGWVITIIVSLFLWLGLSYILRKLMK
ncbi:magnesium transporter CorA family protein [Enterococcus xiangfangensis]|uniref:Magnesium transporter CorA family protein n=1 Tax=Enterococcus xiangfangensis TaxID=1296537 RepID=A0ABU3FAC6_9ENTE|nr:magnesium transporter CorA family protein [Enterococcus xiangfangensis]MDT2758630.1 magnesium transporter CorA family protein [Enterococcus xiangfangensis]NBK08285.1 magnesium transporter CorA family protein [Enterococcus asini]